MRKKGMVLILDFILNHTSNEHQWAINAMDGIDEFEAYYYMFDKRDEADSFDIHLYIFILDLIIDFVLKLGKHLMFY